MKMVYVRCRLCAKQSEALQRDNGHIALCECGGERDVLRVADGYGPTTAHGDDIPGGLTFKHGICNPDGSPRTFYTWSDIRKAEKEMGVINMMDTGMQVPMKSEEQERLMARPGYGQVPSWPNIPGCLTPQDVDALHRRNRKDLGLCVECGAFPGDCTHA